MRVKGGDIHDCCFGCDAVELHTLCAVLIIIRLSLGGENEAVVVLGHVNNIALCEHLRPVADIVLPVGGVGKLDGAAHSVPLDGVDIVIVATVAAAVGGGSGELLSLVMAVFYFIKYRDMWRAPSAAE